MRKVWYPDCYRVVGWCAHRATFTPTSLEVRVVALQGKNYIYQIKTLYLPINSDGCHVAASKTKKNILITLQAGNPTDLPFLLPGKRAATHKARRRAKGLSCMSATRKSVVTTTFANCQTISAAAHQILSALQQCEQSNIYICCLASVH